MIVDCAMYDHGRRVDMVSASAVAMDQAAAAASGDSALNANVARVGMRQIEDMRKITVWVGILAVPPMIAGIYGMNFAHIPELDWRFGYPLAIGLMIVACLVLSRNVKRRDWL